VIDAVLFDLPNLPFIMIALRNKLLPTYLWQKFKELLHLFTTLHDNTVLI